VATWVPARKRTKKQDREKRREEREKGNRETRTKDHVCMEMRMRVYQCVRYKE
jgi:hypothetical protein